MANPSKSFSPAPLARLHETFGDILSLPQTPEGLCVLDTIAAVTHAIEYSQRNFAFELPWAYIQGASASGKTEMLRSLMGFHRFYALDATTPNALISGIDDDNGVDTSTVPELDFKVVVSSDFSGFASAPEATVKSFMGQLRRIYDGDPYRKVTGARRNRLLDARRFVVLLGVTDQIEDVAEAVQAGGERLMIARMHNAENTLDEDRQEGRRAVATGHNRDEWQPVLRDTMHEALLEAASHARDLTHPSVEIDSTCEDYLVLLATIVVRLRTVPNRYDCASPEKPARLAKQLAAVAACRAVLDNRETLIPADLAYARALARDTLCRRLYRVVRAFWRGGPKIGSYNLSVRSLCENAYVWNDRHLHRQLTQYVSAGVLSSVPGKGYRLSDAMHDFLTEANFFIRGMKGLPTPARNETTRPGEASDS